MRKVTLFVVWLAIAGTVLAAPLGASSRFPERIDLPKGFQPEGIAIGKGGAFWVGSIPTGAIYRGDIKSGTGTVINDGAAGRSSVGVELHHNRLFVAGGMTGKGFVYNARTGALLATHTLTTSTPTFVNDVVVARGGAYFTDSQRPFLYRVNRSGVTVIPLSGDISYQAGFNANGIDKTRNGKVLVIVQSNTGKVFRVNPRTGQTSEIALSEPVVNGDGILLDGRTLYVVQNRDNKVAVVRLSRGLASGDVVAHITDPDFDVPTTIDEFGNRLYAVNARFRPTPPPPDFDYWLAQFRKFKH
jgi:sugar lactone lactonase YvrE